MNKIIFPYAEHPICFPFYIDGLAQTIEVNAKGIVLYLTNGSKKLQYLDPFAFSSLDTIPLEIMDPVCLGV